MNKVYPDNWKVLRLNQVASVSIGLVTTMTENYTDVGTPLIRNSDIKENKIRKNQLINLTDSFASQYPSRRLKCRDIVTVHTGDVGVSAVIDDELDGCLGFATLNTRVDFTKLSPNFLCWYFNSPDFLAHAVALSTGDGRQNLNLKDFAKCIVPIPPLPEQRKIAQILSTWDKAITTTELLLTNRQQQKKALMQRLLTGKQRFAGFEGEWQLLKLCEIAEFRRGSFPQPYGLPEWYDEKKGFPFIQVYDIDENMKLKPETKSRISQLATGKSVFIATGTIIISIQGSIGRVAITQYDAYVDRTVLLFTKYLVPINKIFFAYILQELFALEKEKAPGGTIKTITKEVLSDFEVLIPSLEEQQKIASVLSAADAEITTIQNQLDNLKQQKKALMQQLLTGKRRVKV